MASSRNSEPPERIKAAAAACLRRHLQSQPRLQRLVVALSGGRDSVALLHALQDLRSDFGFALGACHINHGLNPDADNWQAFCVKLCAEYGLPLTCARVEVPRDAAEGLEAAARRRRYEVLASAEADWIALAQHRDDQAETLLFNLLRGAGVRGAAAMPEVRPLGRGKTLIRPFLQLGRAEIETYLARHRLAWVEDDSNLNPAHTRNFLRHEVLPLLISRFPAAQKKLADAASHFAEASRLLDELAQLDLAGQAPAFPVSDAFLGRLDEARGRNVLRYLLAKQGIQVGSEERLCEFVRQLREAGPDRHPALTLGMHRISRRRGELHLESV